MAWLQIFTEIAVSFWIPENFPELILGGGRGHKLALWAVRLWWALLDDPNKGWWWWTVRVNSIVLCSVDGLWYQRMIFVALCFNLVCTLECVEEIWVHKKHSLGFFNDVVVMGLTVNWSRGINTSIATKVSSFWKQTLRRCAEWISPWESIYGSFHSWACLFSHYKWWKFLLGVGNFISWVKSR